MWGQSAESLQMTDGGQSDGCRFRIQPAGSLENKNKKRFEKDQAKTTRKKKKGKKKRRKGIVNNLFLTCCIFSVFLLFHGAKKS